MLPWRGSDARRRPLELLAAFVLIAVATRWLSLVVDVVDLDETCHIVGAWQLMRGGLLYTDFVDNKPPLLYAYYAAAQLLAGRGLFAVHLVTALSVVPLTALAVSACYRHPRVGLVAAVTFLLYSAAFIGHDMLATNAEVLMALPASWAIVLVRDEERAHRWWRVLAAGLLLGASVLFKPQVATWIVAWLRSAPGRRLATRDAARRREAQHPHGRRRVRSDPAGRWRYFWARGGLGAFVYWLGVQSLWYAENPITISEGATRFGGNLVPFVVVTGPLWFAWWRGRDLLQPRYWRVLVSALVMASVPPALLGFRFFPHYFIQFYVPLALASAPWLERQLQRPLTSAGRLVLAWTAVVVAGFAIANAALYLGPFHVYRERDPAFRRVADRLRADPCARGGSVFVWGWAPIIYYFADMPPASRFVVLPQSRLTGYLNGNLASNRGESAEGSEVPEHWNWLMDDLERSHATFIVDTAPANVYRWAVPAEAVSPPDAVRGTRIRSRGRRRRHSDLSRDAAARRVQAWRPPSDPVRPAVLPSSSSPSACCLVCWPTARYWRSTGRSCPDRTAL